MDGRIYHRVRDEDDGAISCLSSEVSSTSILIGRQNGGVSIYSDKTTSNHHLTHSSRQGGEFPCVRYQTIWCILKLELKVFFFVQFLITVSSFIIDRIKLIGFAPKDSTIL
jgi:hypothetical protein